MIDSQPDSTYGTADTGDTSLENFFSRPLKTKSFVWATGSDFFQTFNPWQDFFENPRVINRIANFNLLRCKLKVKILLNGNSFFYGRAIASYLPLPSYDGFTLNRSTVRNDIIMCSQRPHIYLDPTESLGGTLSLPFFWHKNALSIPLQDWRLMGDVNIRSMQNLKHANGATENITVSVFVWAEDVVLSIPTADEPAAMSAQMGTKDEYGTGPISRPAGFIAKVAGALSKIRPIAPYAKATQLAASTVSTVAQMFGYSRPAILEDIQPYRPTYVGNMANTNIPDSTVKLTLDAKQETSIDSRIMGLSGTDEMEITSISTRESWLTSIPWTQTAAAETLLWNSDVSPVLWATNVDELFFPACAFAALPFKHWRGTMKFRFQIVASSFHKGRLKIVYDPSYAKTNEYNTNYMHIIDLASERDFTIDVGWGSEFSMVAYKSPVTGTPPYGTTAIATRDTLRRNGVISVYVVNELTTPNSTVNNDVEINVFVSTGDDFEVYNPDGEVIEDLAFFQPQMGEKVCLDPPDITFPQFFIALSGLIIATTYVLRSQVRVKRNSADDSTPMQPQMAEATHPDASETTNENQPMMTNTEEQKAATLSPTDHTVSVYYGDPVVSFRQCLKRYCYYRTIYEIFDGNVFFGITESNFPAYRGYAPLALHNTTVPVTPTPYNYVKMTLLNWVTPAYAARRGSLRKKYMRTGGNSEDDIFYVVRSAEPGQGNLYDINAASDNSTTADVRSREAAMYMEQTWDGAHATNCLHNPVLEVEFPWYENVRFTNARSSFPNADYRFVTGAMHQICGTWKVGPANTPSIHTFVSTGEDFNLAFFLGCPVAFVAQHGDEPAALGS